MEWISVKDKLPEDTCEVKCFLCCLLSPDGKGGAERCVDALAWWGKNKGWEVREMRGVIVTHWMPLPEPPAE